MFQSTRPCGARPGHFDLVALPDAPFQSTRPCGARRRPLSFHCQHGTVSIHAPVRGATLRRQPSVACEVFQSTRPCGARRGLAGSLPTRNAVSIHAPVRGATQWTGWRQDEFQSTRPCGARRSATIDAVALHAVSIHAPVRGATWRRLRYPHSADLVSIHAPVRGATDFTSPVEAPQMLFQSTRPCGARRGLQQ